MSERLLVHIRPARESDTSDMLEVTRHLWEGHDYVPHEWQGWLADPQGALLVAEHQGRAIGLGRLSCIQARDWWMQGLRVHPEFEGRGVASQITEALVEAWRTKGGGAVRLATSSQRFPVHHLCAQLGFVKVGEFTVFVAPAMFEDAPNLPPLAQLFQPLTPSEAEAATAFTLKSPSLALSNGLMDLCWEWAPPRQAYLQQAIERGHAWWWRNGQGLIAIYIDRDDEDIEPPRPFLELAACEMDALAALLLDFRRLAAALGYQKAAWNAPLHPELLPIFEATGYQRNWEHALFVYSKS
jgi:predicted N-acetyltransferase YhbS